MLNTSLNVFMNSLMSFIRFRRRFCAASTIMSRPAARSSFHRAASSSAAAWPFSIATRRMSSSSGTGSSVRTTSHTTWKWLSIPEYASRPMPLNAAALLSASMRELLTLPFSNRNLLSLAWDIRW